MNFAYVQDAYAKGRTHQAPFRKASPAYTANNWIDFSYSAGTPIANYYVGDQLTFTLLNPNTGIFKGVGVDKYLQKIMLQDTSVNQASYMVLDYLMFAPFIDCDSTDKQVLTQIPLPRYSDGAEVMAMVVMQGTGTSSGGLVMNYTNQDGVSGKTSLTTINSALSAGTLGIQDQRPFLQLAQGDTGIRSIESVTMLSPIGGLCAIVLVKVINSFSKYENAPIEIDFLADTNNIQLVDKNAYVHMIAKCPVGSSPITQAILNFIW